MPYLSKLIDIDPEMKKKKNHCYGYEKIMKRQCKDRMECLTLFTYNL